MSNNLKMVIFVIILGTVTSLFLMGMDALTADRIEANKEAEFKSVILNVYDVDFNFNNIHDVFETSVDKVTKELALGENQGSYEFWVDPLTGAISFPFTGDGVWGEISGIITLDDAFSEIISVTVLQQVETPGLGGIVATREYLDTFEGIIFINDAIEVIKKDNTPNDPNQVDAIAGATRTSNAFRDILNEAYTAYKDAWLNGTEV
ncbi:MAG: FMN-binding protein [Bacillota bacterium]|nr:MAG: FMN-binding protein [Bacillota bacterium]